jgi:hypothetical protein
MCAVKLKLPSRCGLCERQFDASETESRKRHRSKLLCATDSPCIVELGYCFVPPFPAGVANSSLPKTSSGLFSLLFGSFRGYFPGDKVA